MQTMATDNPLPATDGRNSDDENQQTDGKGQRERIAAASETLRAQLGLDSAEAAAALDEFAAALLDAVQTDAGRQNSLIKKLGLSELVAHFFEVPCSWHQSTVHFVLTAEGPADERKRLQLLAGSFIQVVMQIATTVTIFYGTYYPSCTTNDQCSPGTYCNGQSCDYCGSARRGHGFGDGPPPMQLDPRTGLVFNRGYDPGFHQAGRGPAGMKDWSGEYNMTTVHLYCADRKGYLRDQFRDVHAYTTDCEPDTYGPLDSPISYCRGGADVCAEDAAWLEYAADAATAWCDSCWHQQTDTVDGTVAWEDVTTMNASSMHIMDILAFLLCTTIVAIGVVGELRDIALCKMAVERAASKPPARRWANALIFLSYLRRRVFLPSLVGDIGFLIIFKGSNALSVCFNSIAIMFLLEVDNGAYTFLLAEKTRKRVELRARIELTDEESATLNRSKNWHAACVVISLSVAIALVAVDNSDINMGYPIVFPFFGFLIAGAADAFFENSTGPARVRAMLRAAALELLGLFGYGVVLMLGGVVVWSDGVAPDADWEEHVAQVRAARAQAGGP